MCERIVPEVMKNKNVCIMCRIFLSKLSSHFGSFKYYHCQGAAFNLTLMMTSAQAVKSSITIKSLPEETANI